MGLKKTSIDIFFRSSAPAWWSIFPFQFPWPTIFLGWHFLVGGFNPFEKKKSQIGSFPQVGVKIKNLWNHHLVFITCSGEALYSSSSPHRPVATSSSAYSKNFPTIRVATHSDEFLEVFRKETTKNTKKEIVFFFWGKFRGYDINCIFVLWANFGTCLNTSTAVHQLHEKPVSRVSRKSALLRMLQAFTFFLLWRCIWIFDMKVSNHLHCEANKWST